MRLVEYSPQSFDALQKAVVRLGFGTSLSHRPFVDYYYAANPWCRLYLLLSAEEDLVGMLGVERMRMECGSRELWAGFGSNFYSLQPGVGGYLFLRWLSSCRIGLVFGGSDDTHRILRKQEWCYFTGIKTYVLNSPFPRYPEDAWWRALGKAALRKFRRARIVKYASRIPSHIRKQVAVREESDYTPDLLPTRSPFAFRFAPTPDSLRWRYNTALSFVRYRLFRILQDGVSSGYVILNDSPARILVAHCDGEDAQILAYGVLLSLVEVAKNDAGPRPVWLASSHHGMQKVYEEFGFRAEPNGRQFVLGPRLAVSFPADTSNWLVNLDWGDNGLRPPFLDQTTSMTDHKH